MNKITIKDGEYVNEYIKNTDNSVQWTISVKGEKQLTSTASNLKEAIKETNELTKPEYNY